MRILQVNTVVNSGSTGRIAEEIGRLVIQDGGESYIAFGRNERPSSSHSIRIGNDFGVKLHGLKTRLTDAHGLCSTQATIKFVDNIKQIRPDIIHLHNLHGYYLNIQVLFRYLSESNLPVVWTLHDCWSFTGHCVHFFDIHCLRWKTGCYACPLKSQYPASILLDRSKRNYRVKKELFTSVRNMTLVPVCNWLDDMLKDSFLKDIGTRIIYNGIDTELFAPQNPCAVRKKYKLENKFILISVANVWNRTKGYEDILRISEHLSSDDILLMVGVNKKQQQELPSNILGIEHTESIHELAELYSVADVFINPTYQDTFPTVNLEAQACGSPVVTYATGGCAEAVSPKSGIVVRMGDISGLLTAITEIKRRGKNFYSSSARENILAHYRKENKCNEYLSLYKDLLSIH